MKSNFVRAGIAGALALGLAACGGTEQFTIKGGVTGLTQPGLVLENEGTTISIAPNATTFAFPDAIDYGDSYNVIVKTNPAHQDCKVRGGKGTAGQYVDIDMLVECVQNAYSLGGKVTGLTADGLVLANGSSTVGVPKDATVFTFPKPVPDGSTYGVTVLNQPTGLNCTVTNGVGTMGETKIENVEVSCSPAT